METHATILHNRSDIARIVLYTKLILTDEFLFSTEQAQVHIDWMLKICYHIRTKTTSIDDVNTSDWTQFEPDDNEIPDPNLEDVSKKSIEYDHRHSIVSECCSSTIFFYLFTGIMIITMFH